MQIFDLIHECDDDKKLITYFKYVNKYSLDAEFIEDEIVVMLENFLYGHNITPIVNFFKHSGYSVHNIENKYIMEQMINSGNESLLRMLYENVVHTETVAKKAVEEGYFDLAMEILNSGLLIEQQVKSIDFWDMPYHNMVSRNVYDIAYDLRSMDDSLSETYLDMYSEIASTMIITYGRIIPSLHLFLNLFFNYDKSDINKHLWQSSPYFGDLSNIDYDYSINENHVVRYALECNCEWYIHELIMKDGVMETAKKHNQKEILKYNSYYRKQKIQNFKYAKNNA